MIGPMSVQISADDVRRFFALLDARAWDEVRALVAEDLVYEVPQTRERIRGAAAWLQFCVDFPGDWHLAADRVVVDPVAREAAVVVAASIDGEPLPNLAFLGFDDAGRVTTFSDWWPEPYEPPSRGTAAVERW
jgi:hypothetical protein